MINSNKYSDKKIIWFPEKMKSFKDDFVKPPIYVRIKPLNRCNHKCFFCVYNYDYSGMHDNVKTQDILSKDKIVEILDDFKDMGVKAVTYSGGGEPLLHPDIIDILKKTKDNGIDLSMITNAQLLNGDKSKELYDSKWVRISSDYFNSKLFNKSRKLPEKKFFDVVNNIENFISNKNKKCNVSINYVITKMNYDKIYEAVEFYKQLKIDNIRLSPVWTNDFMEYHKIIKDSVIEQIKNARKDFQDENYKVYDSYNITEDITKRHYTKCFVMQTIPAIGADGNVYTCHNKAYDKDGIIGNINDKRFKDMWFSDKTKEFFNSFNPQVMCNHQCANDSKNVFIHEMINCYGDNFV